VGTLICLEKTDSKLARERLKINASTETIFPLRLMFWGYAMSSSTVFQRVKMEAKGASETMVTIYMGLLLKTR
jgi:hypothetical protein